VTSGDLQTGLTDISQLDRSREIGRARRFNGLSLRALPCDRSLLDVQQDLLCYFLTECIWAHFVDFS